MEENAVAKADTADLTGDDVIDIDLCQHDLNLEEYTETSKYKK